MWQDGWVVIIGQRQWVQVLSTGRLDCLWRMKGHLLQHPFVRSLVKTDFARKTPKNEGILTFAQFAIALGKPMKKEQGCHFIRKVREMK